MDVRLESLGSDENEILHVLLSKGRFQLVTENAVYSFEDLYVNFTHAFSELQVAGRKPERVLTLGLGLGSIPYILEKKEGLIAEHTAVEIDEAVIHLAHKYTLSGLESQVQTICADAEAFSYMTEETFDLVCMDIFKDVIVPENFESLEFLKALQSLVAPGGLLLFNRLYHTSEDRKVTDAFVQGNWATVFPDGKSLEHKGNLMLFWEYS